ncbi:MAG: hypothetical protein QM675_00125 [Protaetiibacter sp.]
MNDPQIWTLIGVFSAIVIGGMSITTTLLGRNITTAIGGLRGEMNARFDAVNKEMNARFDSVNAEMYARFEAVGSRFDAVDARIDGLHAEMNARFETVNARIDHLDRDVAALTRRVWGEAPER